jgi:hypothetical protein
VVKVCDEWCCEPDQGADDDAGKEGENEDRRFVIRRDLPALDQCRAETGIHQSCAETGEHDQHRDQSEILRRQQPGKNDGDPELHAVPRSYLQEAPPRGMCGALPE